MEVTGRVQEVDGGVQDLYRRFAPGGVQDGGVQMEVYKGGIRFRIAEKKTCTRHKSGVSPYFGHKSGENFTK